MSDIGENRCNTAQKRQKQQYSCAQEVRLFYEFNLLNTKISPQIKTGSARGVLILQQNAGSNNLGARTLGAYGTCLRSGRIL